VIFLGRGFYLTTNNLYQIIPVLYKNWSITFDIMPREISKRYTNIIHVGLGGNMDVYGDRVPAIFFKPETTRLHICSAIDGDEDFNRFGSTPDLPLFTWSNVIVGQCENEEGNYEFFVELNGETFFRVVNEKPDEFRDVKVYLADNHHNTANAKIDNLKIETESKI